MHYPKKTQKTVPWLYRLPGGGSSGAQVWTYLRRGKSCSVRASCWALGHRDVAMACCILLCWGTQGTSAPPQAAAKLLQFTRDQLSRRLFALLQYLKPLVQIKMAPASVSFPFQNKISQTKQQTFGGEMVCVHSWEVSGHHIS